MPKPRKTKPQTNLSLEDYLKTYDYKTLSAAINGLNDSLAWNMMRGYLKLRQREFEIAALDLAGHTGRTQEAAKASGYAQGLEDTADNFMQQLIDMVYGKTGVVEDPRPEEVAS